MSGLFGGGSHVTTRADKIASFQATTCDFGTPLAICYGTSKRGPNLINWQDFTAREIVTRTKTGKNSSSTSINYQYYTYLELALCEGTIAGIRRVWIGDQVYSSLGSSGVGFPLSLNPGNNPNPTAYMQSHHPSIAVGYRNMAYLYGFVFLGENAASVPSYQFEIQGLLRSTGDGTDANPADVIIDLLSRIGYAAYVDTDSFENYRRYCAGADLLISTPSDAFTNQKKCQEVIKEILTITNAYMFWSVDRFKVVPRDDRARGSWTPDTVVRYRLTPNEMAVQDNGSCILYERKDSSEVFNRFGVSFTNRANNYEVETVFYEDTDDILTSGLRTSSDFSAHWLHTTSRAVTVAEMQARINRTENVRYKFKLSWEFGLLEPGDLVMLTDPVIGLNNQLAMIESIDEDSQGLLSVTAIRRDASASGLSYQIDDPEYNIISYNAEPGDVETPLMITPPADLVTSASGVELWIGLHGQTAAWGGCNVYASTKDGAYEIYGRFNKSSNFGYTLTAVAAYEHTVDVHFSNVGTVEILEGSAADAENCLTDIWINGECMAYTGAELIGSNSYRLTGLIRGKYGTAILSHNIGEGFAMLDGSLFVVSLTKNLLGKMLYFKFTSANVFGNNLQELNDVDYYNHRVHLYDIPNVTNLTAVVTRNADTWDIALRWTAPDWTDYSSGRVSYKLSGASQWTYFGMATTETTITGIDTAGTYNISVATRDINGNYETEDDGTKITVTLST
jgi:hypothetical protein